MKQLTFDRIENHGTLAGGQRTQMCPNRSRELNLVCHLPLRFSNRLLSIYRPSACIA